MSDLALQFRKHFETVTAGGSLTEDDAREAFSCIMQGCVPDIELAAFLAALKVRGETVDEIAGAAAAMSGFMIPVEAPPGAIDVVGTGGSQKSKWNVSTATAFVLAGAGVPVAKHGNRSASSKSGAADVLEQLGVNINSTPAALQHCFRKAGLAFLWAPSHHPAMRYAAPVRRSLKIRTIFNLLGPLVNPARAERLLIGTYSPQWVLPMAEVMKRAGAVHVWVVHGSDGMDELSATGPSNVAELKDGTISTFEVHPSDAGLSETGLTDLAGGTPEDNARAMIELFNGKPGPFRDIVILNAAAAFIIAGRAANLIDGASMAARSIDEGLARTALDALIAASRGISLSAEGAAQITASTG
jgi:anthranilate phosphoribosyltransferase